MSGPFVLVTGATGGLGLSLIPALRRAGYQVRAVGRRTDALARLAAAGCQCVQADLCDPGASELLAAGVEAVFHAAARSSPWGSYALFRRDNVEATERLLHAARSAGVQRFVYVSTPSVYAEARDRLDLTEESPLAERPINVYAATKLEAERLVLAADAPGFATVALRPRALVGPHDRVLLPRVLRIARQGWFPLFRGGSAQMDLTDVRDAVDALLATDRWMEAVHGRVFNISGGQPLAVREMLDEVFAALRLRPRLVALPYAPTALLAEGLETVYWALPGKPEPPICAHSLTALAFSQTFDLTRARAELGWSPRRSPRDALAWAAQGFTT